ncbi:DNA cytosine methyltransferase [Catellatospora bangladeshensis]|uniref:DNA cytosine methyltransferase n=1 Tax=Catellatospora bangladeshensis TaxID=310355 RepID=UPI00360E7108
MTTSTRSRRRGPAPDTLPCPGLRRCPCQPFSTEGKRRGVNDERWLWPAVVDTLRVLRPRYLLMENVPALLADRHAFGIILADLAALGFDAQWAVLSAADFGAPHPRERLILVAHPQGRDGSQRDLLGQGRAALTARSWRTSWPGGTSPPAGSG